MTGNKEKHNHNHTGGTPVNVWVVLKSQDKLCTLCSWVLVWAALLLFESSFKCVRKSLEKTQPRGINPVNSTRNIPSRADCLGSGEGTKHHFHVVSVINNVFSLFLYLLLLTEVKRVWHQQIVLGSKIISDLYTLYPPSLPGYKYDDSVMAAGADFKTSPLHWRQSRRRDERSAWLSEPWRARI